MEKIQLHFSGAGFTDQFNDFQGKVSQIHQRIYGSSQEDENNLGWFDAPEIWLDQISAINGIADKIRANSKALVIVGIGGSYLGSRAAISALKPVFYNRIAAKEESLEIYYAGNSLSADYLHDLLGILADKDFSIIVISKSGTTLEPAISFRLLKKMLEDKYAESAKDRIFIITDENKGVLREIATKNDYQTLPVPDNVGGRYSVLTPVGLLPIASAGIDIKELIEGALQAKNDFASAKIEENLAYQYAVARHILYKKQGKKIEIMANYEPRIHYFAEWWKQLFGESEGKDGKALFPASVDLTTDLHSMGQYIQEGPRHLFETVLNVESSENDLNVPESGDDGLDFINGKSINHINKQAYLGTLQAHTDGGVPNIVFDIPNLTPFNLGYLFFTFELACVMSSYLLDVSPYGQPGVEAYKKNMFALLEK